MAGMIIEDKNDKILVSSISLYYFFPLNSFNLMWGIKYNIINFVSNIMLSCRKDANDKLRKRLCLYGNWFKYFTTK
jgi:hypothetical protein